MSKFCATLKWRPRRGRTRKPRASPQWHFHWIRKELRRIASNDSICHVSSDVLKCGLSHRHGVPALMLALKALFVSPSIVSESAIGALPRAVEFRLFEAIRVPPGNLACAPFQEDPKVQNTVVAQASCPCITARMAVLRSTFQSFPPHCNLRRIGNNTGFTLCPASKERMP